MNKFVRAVKDLDLKSVTAILAKDPKWAEWAESDGKNGLHYLCGVPIVNEVERSATSLKILQLLLNAGMDINSIHRIVDGCGIFPGTPLWYAYTRGRNVQLYTYLLEHGADPEHCMFAIAWYDDPDAADLFKKSGARVTDENGADTPFLAAWGWKKFRMAEWFLNNGADVDAVDEKGNSALYYAVKMKRKYDIADISLLLRYGADINKANQEGVSPLLCAQQERRKSVLALLKNQPDR